MEPIKIVKRECMEGVTAIEILAEAADAVRAARGTLEQKEMALRDILPPCSELDNPCGFTSEDAADFIYSARYALDDAAYTLNQLIKAAEAGRLNGDKDKECGDDGEGAY